MSGHDVIAQTREIADATGFGVALRLAERLAEIERRHIDEMKAAAARVAQAFSSLSPRQSTKNVEATSSRRSRRPSSHQKKRTQQ